MGRQLEKGTWHDVAVWRVGTVGGSFGVEGTLVRISRTVLMGVEYLLMGSAEGLNSQAW